MKSPATTPSHAYLMSIILWGIPSGLSIFMCAMGDSLFGIAFAGLALAIGVYLKKRRGTSVSRSATINHQ